MNQVNRMRAETALSEEHQGKTAPPLLATEEHDNLARISYQLLAELWIARDRLAVLEQVLSEKGMLSPGEIDSYEPAGEFAERLEMLRDHMIENVAGAPFANALSVADLKERGRRLRKISGEPR